MQVAYHSSEEFGGAQEAVWRSLKRWILPVDVFGSSGMNSTQRGYLYGASESFTNALSSSASAGAAAAPSAQTTYAQGLTRPSPSARATTAHSRTAACRRRTDSTSSGETQWPLTRSRSSERPWLV